MQGLGEASTSVGVMGVRPVPQDLMGQRLDEQSEMNDFGSNSNSFSSQIVILGC